MSPRRGSRKASVFETFAKDGADGAIAIGVSLGLKLGTVRSWIGSWMKDTTEGDQPNGRQMQTKSTIIVTWDPERVAYLIHEGDEVSEIRWADTGQHMFLANRHLEKK